MKPRQIRRGIKSHHSRDLGNAPRIGRIAKLRGSERGRSARGHQSASSAHRYRTMLLVGLLAAVVLMVIVVGAWVGLKLRSRFTPTEIQISNSPKTEEQVRIVSKVKSPSEDRALELVMEALKSSDPKSVEERFRLTETPAADVLKFLKETQAAGVDSSNLRWMGSADIEGLLMESVLVEGRAGDSKFGRTAFLVPDDKGEWKVDFEAYARACRPDWKELLEGRAERAKVRVLLAPDSYYNGPFAEEATWECFGMSSPEAGLLLSEEQRVMYGYCRKNSPQARALERVLSSGSPIMRVTLEVVLTNRAEKLQFEITRVLSEDWVVPERAFDERFL